VHKWLIDLKDSFGLGTEIGAAARLAVNLMLGGLLSLYVRELFRRFSSTISNRDSLANIFPLLTLTTISVIFVVRSSLALSLGLVGALSIVRFRAAIKEPEELVFLFFCIAIGLAIGADHKLLALVAVFVISVFCVARPWLHGKPRQRNLLVTVSGESNPPGLRPDPDFLRVVNDLVGGCTIQRFDVDEHQMQLRAVVRPERPEQALALVEKLHEEMPGCRISYVDLETLL
jgi:hypothetical protein